MVSPSSPQAPERAPEAPAAAGSLLDRVLKGTIALWLVTGVNVIGQIVTVPIAMHAWGKSRWGEWVALSAVIAFLTNVDLGVQPHVVNRMSASHARGDTDALLADLHSAFRVQSAVIAAVWCLGAAALAFLPIKAWYGVETASRLEVYLTVVLLGTELLIGVLMGPVGGTYRAAGRLARASMLNLVQRLFFFAVPLGLMLAGGGFVLVALARVAVAVLVSIWIVADLRFIFPWFSASPLRGSMRAGLLMLVPGSLFALTGLADYLATQGTVMVVQSIIGGAAVTQLATQRTMVNMGRMIASQITSAVWPELTALDERGERGGLVRLHRSMAKLVSFLIGAMLLALLPVARLLYAWWTLRELSFDPYIYGFLAAQSIAWGVWGSSSTVLVATNRQRTLAGILLANACATVALALLLAPRFGIRGAAAAGLLAELAIVAWMAPRAACAAIGDRPLDHAREVLPPLLAGLVLPAIPAGLVFWLLPWPAARGVVAPLVGLPIGAVAFYFMLAPAERRAARRVLDKARARLQRT